MSGAGERLHEIARIGKVHGLDGTVRVIAPEQAGTLFRTGNLLYLKNRRGDLIPSRITEIRTEAKQHQIMFFVKFDRIPDRTTAEMFQDTAVYSDRELPGSGDPSGLPEDLSGFSVAGPQGRLGVVEGIMESPAHPILEVKLDGRESGDPLLVPWVDEYVESVDPDTRTVVCRNLEQLMNL